MRHTLICLGLSLTHLASCAGESPKPAASAPPRSAASLLAELRAEIGDAPCVDDSQCRTVAVGAKACGGPGGYMAWSTKQGDADRIRSLASVQARADRLEQQHAGMASNCALVTDPGAVCRAGRCELRPRGAPGQAPSAQ